MQKSLTVLDRIQIASPCTVSWDSMTGDDRSRYCSQCQQSVHNLSAMSVAEVKELFQNGTACVSLFRRADGTIITRDCPEAHEHRSRRLFRKTALVLASWLGFSTLFGCSLTSRRLTGGISYIDTPDEPALMAQPSAEPPKP
jgi:hypothetical protein